MEEKVKYKNKIKCKFCNDIIESKYRHDFKYCKCGSVTVDGGLDYGKYSFPDGKSFEESIEIILEEI